MTKSRTGRYIYIYTIFLMFRTFKSVVSVLFTYAHKKLSEKKSIFSSDMFCSPNATAFAQLLKMHLHSFWRKSQMMAKLGLVRQHSLALNWASSTNPLSQIF